MNGYADSLTDSPRGNGNGSAGLGHPSTDTTLSYRMIRNRNGVVVRLRFEAPHFILMETEIVESERIPIDEWLRMAIERLGQGQTALLQDPRFRSTLSTVLEQWQRGQLRDGQYLSVQQIGASLGTVWYGGAYSRGSTIISDIAMDFISQGEGDYGYYMPRYLFAQSGGGDANRELDSWIRQAYQRVQGAWEGMDHLRVRAGEAGVPIQPENRSAVDAMVLWRNGRRGNPDAFLSHICSIGDICGR